MEVETTTEAYKELALVPVCFKNPNHVGFYDVKDLNSDILAERMRDEELLSYIREFSKLVVRLTVKKDNGTCLYGSGYVHKNANSDTLCIKTNHHVVGSQEDVTNCIIDFFYDTTDMKEIEKSYGLNLEFCTANSDRCEFTFHPVPPKIRQLMSKPIVEPSTSRDSIIVIGHPHGGPKKITIGNYLTRVRKPNDCTYIGYKHIYTAKTCPGSSGGLVIDTWSLSPPEWRDDYNHYTHCEGERCDVYQGMKSETSNINQSAYDYEEFD